MYMIQVSNPLACSKMTDSFAKRIFGFLNSAKNLRICIFFILIGLVGLYIRNLSYSSFSYNHIQLKNFKHFQYKKSNDIPLQEQLKNDLELLSVDSPFELQPPPTTPTANLRVPLDPLLGNGVSQYTPLNFHTAAILKHQQFRLKGIDLKDFAKNIVKILTTTKFGTMPGNYSTCWIGDNFSVHSTDFSAINLDIRNSDAFFWSSVSAFVNGSQILEQKLKEVPNFIFPTNTIVDEEYFLDHEIYKFMLLESLKTFDVNVELRENEPQPIFLNIFFQEQLQLLLNYDIFSIRAIGILLLSSTICETVVVDYQVSESVVDNIVIMLADITDKIILAPSYSSSFPADIKNKSRDFFGLTDLQRSQADKFTTILGETNLGENLFQPLLSEKSLYSYGHSREIYDGFYQSTKVNWTEISRYNELIANHGVPFKKLKGTCAVVGSGDLKGFPEYTQRLVESDYIFRCNAASVHGYEDVIGSKTDYRIIYPESIGERFARDGTFIPLAFTPEDLTFYVKYCLYNQYQDEGYKFWKTPDFIRANETVPFKCQNKLLMSNQPIPDLIKSLLHYATKPSTGIIGAFIASSMCEKVIVLGMGLNPVTKSGYYYKKESWITQNDGRKSPHSALFERMLLRHLQKETNFFEFLDYGNQEEIEPTDKKNYLYAKYNTLANFSIPFLDAINSYRDFYDLNK